GRRRSGRGRAGVGQVELGGGTGDHRRGAGQRPARRGHDPRLRGGRPAVGEVVRVGRAGDGDRSVGTEGGGHRDKVTGHAVVTRQHEDPDVLALEGTAALVRVAVVVLVAGGRGRDVARIDVDR